MTEPSNRNNGYNGVCVAVLGASGFIGRWVARVLCARGANVHLIVRNQAAAQKVFSRYGVQGDIVELDLGPPGVIQRLFRQIKPSITFNLAGYGVDRSERDEKTAYQINVHLVQAICEAIAETRDREWWGQDIVHVGSVAEYGTLGNDLSEDAVPNPTTLYGKSKLAGTRSLACCCQARRIKGLTARLFSVYGPGEHRGRLLPALLETARTGKSLRLTAGKQERDFIYVEDVAEGLLRLGLVKAQPGEMVNLATGQLTSVRTFAETAAGVLQIPYDRLEFGSLPTRAEEMKHSPVTLERLRQLIAWVPPTGVAEGVGKTLDFEHTCSDDED
jgi:nucleoside-diphosphate-sugar epimerase